MHACRTSLVPLASAAALMLLAVNAQADTRNVPSTAYPTIQSAINAALGGDTILVAAGTYKESLSWVGKDLKIQGAGAGQSIIDPSASGGPGRQCLYTENVPATSRLEGFTLQNGKAIADSTVYGGYPGYGGGMYNNNSSPTVTHCTFSGNVADYGGGGMYNANGSSPTVSDCAFISNASLLAGTGGGGMLNSFGTPTVTRCTFSDNGSWNNAGGMYNYASAVTVSDCTFTGNHASDAGGLYNYYGGATIVNCVFNGNVADDGGGMTIDSASSTTVTDCTFSGNRATNDGGGLKVIYSSPTLTNCAFSGNSATNYGGGLFGFFNNNLTLTNCIVWGNAANVDNGVHMEASGVTVTYSDVQDGYAGTGNINSAPLFVRDPSPGPDAAWGTPDDDFGNLRLQAGSPCIDAGNNAAVTSPPFLAVGGIAIDLDVNQRIANGTVDLGAYEFGSVAVVTDTTAPTLTWGTPTPAPNAAGWSRSAVDIPFTTADDGSGVSPTSPVGPLHFGSEGSNQTQIVTITDNAGNSKDFTSPAVNIDWTPPTTSASSSGTTTTTVTLAHSDNLSGVNATYYRIDGGAPQTYAGPFTLAQGLHEIYYWSVDNADNEETHQYLAVDTRYAVTVVVANVSGKRGGKVTLSATVTQTGTKTKLSGKAVTLLVDGVFVGNAYTNKQGVASLSFTIPTSFATGAHAITATAQPNGTYKSGYGTGTLTVNR